MSVLKKVLYGYNYTYLLNFVFVIRMSAWQHENIYSIVISYTEQVKFKKN